jgi:hypothetical protein
VAGAIGRGLALKLGVGLGDGVGAARVGLGECVASPALLVMTVGLGVAVLEQATTASSRAKIEPIRARSPVRTLSSKSCVAQSHHDSPPTALVVRPQAPFHGPAYPAAWEPPDETMMLSPSLLDRANTSGHDRAGDRDSEVDHA